MSEFDSEMRGSHGETSELNEMPVFFKLSLKYIRIVISASVISEYDRLYVMHVQCQL